jgi:two-component system LytT family response regulator
MNIDPIRALIVDDEEPGRLNLRYALADHPDWRVAAECAGVDAALKVLGQATVDVVFLDIQMPRRSGFELARWLSTQAEPPLVIFVTAYSAHAVHAFELHALDYLLKPFDGPRFAQALARARELLALRQSVPYAGALRGYLDNGASGQHATAWSHVTVRSVGRMERIALAEVRWLGGAGNYVELHLDGRTVLHRVTLATLEAHLPQPDFMRTHRSAIVRADQCRSLTVHGDGSYRLTLHCGAVVPVSERYVAAVRARLG